MSAVVLQLPEVWGKEETRPSECPYCYRDIFQRWGKVRKHVRDNCSQLARGQVSRE